MLRLLAPALAMPLLPAAAHAQTAPTTAAVSTPEPARLAAAQALLARFLPPERRDAMVDQMVRPVVDNMRQAMSTDPQFVALRNENPKFGPLFDDFMASEFEHSLATTKAAMPALIDAMARAYARRFTIEQLTAISAFLDTPAGRAFVDQSMTIMSDPDILAVQRKMIAEAVTGLQKRAETFAGKVVEAAGKDD